MSEVREGYKITELGEIPSKWEVKTIKELFETLDGDRGKNYPSPGEFSEKGYCLFLDTGNVKKNGFNLDNLKFITEEKHNSLRAGTLKRGDIVLTSRGTIGNIAIYNEKVPYNTVRINSAMLILRPIFKELDLNFIVQLLRGKTIENFVRKSKVGSAQPHITKSELNKHKIIIPPLDEQTKIASILSTVDKQIDETKQLIIKTKELKKALMQQLLTKGIGHAEFKQTELGEIPSEWEVIKIGEKCTVKSSKRVHLKDYVEEGIPFYRSKEIKALSKRNPIQTEIFISSQQYEEIKNKFGVPKKGDLLITSVGTIGDVWISDGREFYYKDGNLTQINKNQYIIPEFLRILFDSDLLKKQYLGQSSGSAQMALTIEKINKLKIVVPCIEEQQKIAEILSTVDAQIEVYEEEKAKYEELKKGLMQKLLTGQIRVKI